LILHSDRGGEFANARFHGRAAEAKIRLSMSSTGNCYDNAAAERFLATVTLEVMPEGIFPSRQAARAALFDYIEVFSNRQRLHSGIDYARPVSRAAWALVSQLNGGRPRFFSTPFSK
jgi:putative transposase